MTDVKRMSSEMLCFTLSHIETQIASSVAQKKDVLAEIKRRNEVYKQKFNRGELQLETDEFMEGDENGEPIREDIQCNE